MYREQLFTVWGWLVWGFFPGFVYAFVIFFLFLSFRDAAAALPAGKGAPKSERGLPGGGSARPRCVLRSPALGKTPVRSVLAEPIAPATRSRAEPGRPALSAVRKDSSGCKIGIFRSFREKIFGCLADGKAHGPARRHSWRDPPLAFKLVWCSGWFSICVVGLEF